jgi:hypothetical protein
MPSPGVVRESVREYLSNDKTLTWNIVHGLEQRGIPAFGPVWDS